MIGVSGKLGHIVVVYLVALTRLSPLATETDIETENVDDDVAHFICRPIALFILTFYIYSESFHN